MHARGYFLMFVAVIIIAAVGAAGRAGYAVVFEGFDLGDPGVVENAGLTVIAATIVAIAVAVIVYALRGVHWVAGWLGKNIL